MKNLIFLFSVVLFFSSCENVETNSPAFQAKVNNVFFKSGGTVVSRANHAVEVIGNSENQKITLNFRLDEGDNLILGEGPNNFATFEDNFGNIYSTGSDVTGELNFTHRSGGNRVISGTFKFTAILPSGLDTITVNKGIFYEIRTIE